VTVGGAVGWGQLAWWRRLTFHLIIFRLTTRGLARARRWGLSLARSCLMACFHSASTRGWLGGKIALVGDRAAGDPEGGDEGDPVGVSAADRGGVGHQGPDRVVAAQVAPDLLVHQVW
jgi:hypothetical protein